MVFKEKKERKKDHNRVFLGLSSKKLFLPKKKKKK